MTSSSRGSRRERHIHNRGDDRAVVRDLGLPFSNNRELALETGITWSDSTYENLWHSAHPSFRAVSAVPRG